MVHGTRQCYRTGCTCCPCRAAEASYRAELRKDHARGRLRLGVRLSASEARKRIAQLKAEHVTGVMIVRHLGLKRHSLVVHPSGITRGKLLKLKRIYDYYMALGPDHPLDTGPHAV